jgi:predicted esterase
MRQFINLAKSVAHFALGFSLFGLLAAPAGLAAEPDKVLISAEKLDGPWVYSAKAVRVSHAEMQEPPPAMPRGTSIQAFRIKYRTKNLQGKPVMASGLVRIRSDLMQSANSLPVISYQHSTRIMRVDSPSTNFVDPEGLGGAIFFASRGFVWAMPDYLGLGVSKEPQAYLHSRGQAIVCADFLVAVEEWAASHNLRINPSVITMGYSQGGHSTMALQKYLESEDNHTHFSVRASFPMAGPFSVAGVGLEQAIKSKSATQLLFVALAFYGLSNDPSLNIDLKKIINAKYESVLPKMFSGDLSFGEAADMMPRDAKDFFTTAFLTEVLISEANHPSLQALKDQDVVDFKAIAPVYLLHAPNDETVLYENSTLAQKYLRARGSQVELITLDKKFNHIDAALPAFAQAARIIDREGFYLTED